MTAKKPKEHRHYWKPLTGHDETGSILQCSGCDELIFVDLEDYKYVMDQQKKKKAVQLIYKDTKTPV